jgi:ATP-dependent 26S proteasome regulatory subunit
MPNAALRERVLRVMLASEGLPADFDYTAVARDEVTGGFSGSDLKTMCIAACYRPVRDLLSREEELR